MRVLVTAFIGVLHATLSDALPMTVPAHERPFFMFVNHESLAVVCVAVIMREDLAIKRLQAERGAIEALFNSIKLPTPLEA